MHQVYALVSGPLAWIAFILFFAGILVRLAGLIRMAAKTEKFIFSYMSLKYSLRSILHWLVPFGTASWRLHPLVALVTFAFHLCLILVPLFLMSHIVLLDEAWDLSWWALPDPVADWLTVLVIASCVFFLIRRLTRREVRFVTDTSDFVLLAIVAAPFVTGLLSYHQWTGTSWMTIVHMLAGEVMLAAVPFTRLSHMIFAPLTRAYMGSEFGKVRHARDW